MGYADSDAKKALEILQTLEQNRRYAGKKISELSEQELTQFYGAKDESGKLAYQCYRISKQSCEYTEACKYFILALDYENDDAKAELELAHEELKHSISVLEDNKLTAGKAEDNFILGMQYLLGMGRSKNKAAALMALEWAAEGNHVQAQYQLACLLLKFDKEKGMFWLKVAADQGYRAAESLLATKYHSDNEEEKVLQNTKYFNYFLSAAEKGDIGAQLNLAYLLEKDVNDITNSPQQALIIKWYRLSALQGVVKAQYNLAMIYKKLGRLDNAFEWFSTASIGGDLLSKYELGLMYEDGKGAPKDIKIAAEFYLFTACEGHAESQFRLATIYSTTHKLYDPNSSARWYRCAAEQQHKEAIKKLQEGATVSSIYHSLMVQEKIDEVMVLINNNPDELIQEVLDDLRFPTFSIKSHAKTLQIVSKLIAKDIAAEELKFARNNYYLSLVLRIHHESDHHDSESLQLLLENIINIDVSALDKETINQLVIVIIDICYQSPKNRQVMVDVTQVLIKLIIRSYSIGTLNTIPERQNCILLLVSNLNSNYEHNMSTQLTDEQLFALSSICKLNNQSPIQIIHQILGVNFIINRREDNIRRVLTLLQRYLTYVSVSESSPLHDFKLLLNQELLSAEPNSQKIFLKLYQIITPSLKTKGSTFFSDSLDNSEQFKTFCERLINSQDNPVLEIFEQLKAIGNEIPVGPC